MITAGSSVVLTTPHAHVPVGTPGYVLQRTGGGAQVRFDLPERSVMAVVPDAALRPAMPGSRQSNPVPTAAVVLLTLGGVAILGAVGYGIYRATRPEPPLRGPLVPPPPPPIPPFMEDEDGLETDDGEPGPFGEEGLGETVEEDLESTEEGASGSAGGEASGPLTSRQKLDKAWSRWGFQLERAALNAASRIGRRFKGLEGSLPVPKDPRLRTMLVAMSPGAGGGSGAGSGGGGGSLGLQNPTMPTGPEVWSEDEALIASALAWNSVMPAEWQAPWGRVVFSKIPDVAEGATSAPGILAWAQPQLTAGQGSGTTAVNLFGRLVAETMDNLGAADQERQAPSGDTYVWDWRGRYGG